MKQILVAILIAALACVAPRADAQAQLTNLTDALVTIPEGSWVKVNQSAFSSVWTPVDLQTAPYVGDTKPGSIIAAWSSFAWDVNRGKLILWGGGHANYAGNEVYTWDGVTQLWQRGSVPSEVRSNGPVRYEAIDGAINAPVSSHTYDNQVFLPRIDRFLTFGGAAFDDGGPQSMTLGNGTVRPTGPFLWDPTKADPNKVGGTTGSHVQRVSPHPEITGGQMWKNLDIYDGRFAGLTLPNDFVQCTSDTLIENGFDTIYVTGRGPGTSQNLYRFQIQDLNDRSRDTWQLIGPATSGNVGKGAGAFDPVRRIFVRSGGLNSVTYWDVTTPSVNNSDLTATLQDLSGGMGIDENYGMDLDPYTGDFLMWGGGGAVWRISAPTPLASTGWVAMREPAPVGAVPSTSFGTGILGKFKYVTNLHAFVALDVTGDVWLYKPLGWTNPDAPPFVGSVSIASPQAGASFTAPGDITLTANAASPNGIARVDYFAGTSYIGSATSAPYTVVWTGVPLGQYSLTAIAIDLDGAALTSSPVSINVILPTGVAVNVAASVNGGVATASTIFGGNYPASAVNNGDRKGLGWGNGGGWNDATFQFYPDWVQIDFAGPQPISEIDVFTIQDNYPNPSEPTLQMTFANYGVTAFQVQTWNGSAWVTVPNGAVTGNNKVWRQFVFPTITTSKIRVNVTGAQADYSRLVEVEAWVTSSNPPPTVSLTAPTEGTTYTAVASVALAANASDDGNVTSVDFLNGSTVIGTATTAPYTFTWNNVAAGDYTLTARATDNLGATATSTAVHISVQAPNVPPTVSLTAPASGAIYNAPASIALTASASDDGSVTKVEFLNGTTVIATVTSAPYTFTWTSVPVGTYSLSARATDNLGAVTTSTAASVTVSTNMALQANGGIAVASSVLNSAYAASGANNGDRRGLNWGAGGGWNDASFNAYPDSLQINFSGQKTINRIDVFTVQDNYGSPVEPTLTQTFSLYGVTAFDVQTWDGASWVTVTGGSITGNSRVWRSVTFPDVTTDRMRVVVNAGLSGYSRLTEVEAWGTNAAVNPPPTVSLTAPAEGASYTAPASVALAATASDDGSVSKVDFLNGSTVIGTANTAPYTFTWNNVAAGNYTLTARATDNLGATATSTAVHISVQAPNVPPTVSLTAPASGAIYNAPASIALAASASDDGSVTKVEFLNGTTVIATVTSAPYTFTWTSVPVGTYSLSARATDNLGAVTTSTAASVTVSTNMALQANGGIASASSIYSAAYPATGVNNGDRRGLNWSVGGGWNDGTLNAYPDWLQVNFSGQKTINRIDVFTVQDNYSAPADPTLTQAFSLYGVTAFDVQTWNGSAWVTVPAGSVTGNNRVWRSFTFADVTTDRIRVQVNASLGGYSRLTEIEAWGTSAGSNPPPTVNLTAPAEGQSYSAGATVTLTAIASDDGSVTKVELLSGTTVIATLTSAPYTFDWVNVAAGNYTLTARATDNLGAVSTSTAVHISVLGPNPPPTVTLTAPASGAIYNAPASITLTASASDDGSVTKVEFLNGTTVIGTVTNAPYTFAWTSVGAGSYTVSARATDNLGATTTSSTANVTVSTNVALQSNGGVAAASSTYSSGFPASGAINGDRRGLNWGGGGGWNDASTNAYPDSLQINFSGQKTIGRIDVFTVQDGYSVPIEPTLTQTFSLYGITAFDVQTWDGTSWVTVPGGSVTGNNRVWRSFTFPSVTTDRVRVVVNAALGGYSRVTEIEAWQ